MVTFMVAGPGPTDDHISLGLKCNLCASSKSSCKLLHRQLDTSPRFAPQYLHRQRRPRHRLLNTPRQRRRTTARDANSITRCRSRDLLLE